MFSGVNISGEENADVIYQPVYEVKGLAGAVYEITAAEDIITPDGTLRYAKGEVVDTVTTDENGLAKSKEIYLGRYTVVEITAPEGIMVKSNAENLYDERVNLNIQLSQPIIVIGDLGRWNGRVSGYKMIDSGNIKDCLYSDTDYTEWYVDKYGDLRADAVHHDGTNRQYPHKS